jgi:hypothetical protein
MLREFLVKLRELLVTRVCENRHWPSSLYVLRVSNRTQAAISRSRFCKQSVAVRHQAGSLRPLAHVAR